jgi:hypothetical protein
MQLLILIRTAKISHAPVFIVVGLNAFQQIVSPWVELSTLALLPQMSSILKHPVLIESTDGMCFAVS